MSNSPLVSYVQISPNKTSPRKSVIDGVLVHCVVGQVSVQSLGAWFAKSSTAASSNYGIGKDGKIALFVDEDDRAWTSGGKDEDGNIIRVNGFSGADMDHRSITIEVASDTSHPYAVNDAAYNALIELLVDICKRHPEIKNLRWKADKSLVGNIEQQNMAVHRWFSTKECPGDYLYTRHSDIVRQVNARLGTQLPENYESPEIVDKPILYRVRKTWEDYTSQLGAFHNLQNAKNVCDQNPGYFVFDESKNAVYPEQHSRRDVVAAKSRNDNFKGKYKIISESGLNLRYEPGVLSPDNIIACIPNGSYVFNYGYYTKVDNVVWLYVAYGDMTGFVHSDYLKKS